ncbi:tagaturonate reductase [Danxiaibacter flavus]|uniref:Tagaturonate reductase n=1 Tax=Danxiaibacter flavus TaxID=3049108 RepID=A0ABV3ZC80_9BACT|nr:tagaturonate reductase [Chitinophagaceae bacterium DXS]
MQLSKHIVPKKELPEKVLQFGTGVLLRGLCDYFIDKANKQGIFNGSVVVVKSTSSGGADEFASQDGLYTHFVRGIENGVTKDESIVNESISRVVSANDQWQDVLKCAVNPDIQLIISNTTEVGITYHEENIFEGVPASFPGKLLAFLHERYKAFNGSDEAGMVIIPTELITENATKLKAILLQLAAFNHLNDGFVKWLENANHFCNSLVDRIVPGKLSGGEKTAAQQSLGYTDDLMIMSEVYRLWAIETSSEKVKNVLSFSQADDGVVLAPDIYKFRELKLRLLNGTHTYLCGLAVLAGFETVRDAMQKTYFKSFVTELMLNEICNAITDDSISYDEAKTFSLKVIDRFSNPYIEHKWLSIALQYTSKMLLRNVPVLLKYYERRHEVPYFMATGFAAYLLFMKNCKTSDGEGQTGEYLIKDDKAEILKKYWAEAADADDLVDRALADQTLWQTDLTKPEGFARAVKESIQNLTHKGIETTLQNLSYLNIA